jgi:hypothetical protein
MEFIEWRSSTIREVIWWFTKCSLWNLLARSREWIYWMVLFHDKRRNLIVSERLPAHFIGAESWWYLLNGCSSTIREGTWRFTKDIHPFISRRLGWYLLNGSSSTIREGTLQFTKGSHQISWHGLVMAFIERELFHEKTSTWSFALSSKSILLAPNRDDFYWMWLFLNKRRNLAVYETLFVDLIGSKSGWDLLKESFSTIREGTWSVVKSML